MMSTYAPTPVAPGEAKRVAEAGIAPEKELHAPGQPPMARRRPRRGALAFVSGFMLGAVATTAASIFGRGRRAPFVWGNRNVFVSLPFSGISMSAPSVRLKGRRQRGFARLASMPRGLPRSMARGKKRGQ